MGTRVAPVAAQRRARPLLAARSRAVVRVRPQAAVWAWAAPQLATAVPRRVVEAPPPGAARVAVAPAPEARQVQAPRLPAREVRRDTAAAPVQVRPAEPAAAESRCCNTTTTLRATACTSTPS